MRHKFLVVFFTTLAFVGCQTDILTSEPELPSTQYEFIASTEIFNPETKTSLTSENTIVWNKGDKLAIFQGANIPDTYQVKDDCQGKSEGAFSLVNDNSGDINGEFVSGMEIPANIAVYPYDKDIRCSGVTISDETKTSAYTISNVIIPANQVYTEDSFPQGAFTMVAVTESLGDHNLKFRNVLGALKLQLCGTCTVKSIEIKGNNEEIISGRGYISAYNGDLVPDIKLTDNTSAVITLNCADEVTLNVSEPTSFIFALPPIEFNNGFTVSVIDKDGGRTSITANAPNTIQRSRILKMPVVVVESGENSETGNNIEFEDEVMKELCVNAFDTDGNGELSFDEAAAVTDLSQMQLTKKTFKSFNEFKYFTSVTIVPAGYFKGTGIKSIELPNSITNIYSTAFQDCKSLQSVTLPTGKVSFGVEAFYGCKALTSIIIPEGTTSIGKRVFASCEKLSYVKIPDSVTSIGEEAFAWCYSLNTTIPASVTQIYKGAFLQCEALEGLTLSNNITKIEEQAFWGCSSITNIVIPETIKTIKASSFASCSSVTNVIIPEGVTTIESAAFANCCSLKSINIPQSVRVIDYNAFAGCGLINITVPKTVTSMGGSVFRDCKELTSIVLNNGIIPINTFTGCTSLKEMTIPGNIKTIKEYAFLGCTALTDVVLSEGVNTIYDRAFDGCTSLVNVTIPSSATYIAYNTFSGCSSLTNIVWDNCSEVGGFANCTSLKNINIPESVTVINNGAFQNCTSLESVTIPESVTSIGEKALSGCSSLVSLTIPESVSTIGNKAFENCTSLIDVFFVSETPVEYYNLFVGCQCLEHIYVPLDSENTYKETWPSMSDKIIGYNYNAI